MQRWREEHRNNVTNKPQAWEGAMFLRLCTIIACSLSYNVMIGEITTVNHLIRWKEPKRLLSIINLKLQWFAPILWLPPFTSVSQLCSVSVTNLLQRKPSSWPIFFPFHQQLSSRPNKAQNWNFPISPSESKAGKANESHSTQLKQRWHCKGNGSKNCVWFLRSTTILEQSQSMLKKRT